MGDKRVLIADDDQGVLDLLGEMLRREGYEVSLAANGEEAVEIAQNEPLDVALLDWKMPAMDGVEALREIKTIDQDIEVLIMTAYANIESLDQTLGYGACDYIIKPFHKADLVNAVRAAALKRDLTREGDRLQNGSRVRMDQLEERYEERTRQLRRSQIEYKQIIEHSNDAIAVAQDGVLKFVNPKTLEMTGYTQGEILQIPFVNLIHPDDRAMVQERHARRLNGEEFPHTYMFRVLRKDGEPVWVEINAIRTLWEERPATLNFIRDVTQRKRAEDALRQSEEKYHLLFNSAADLIAVIDIKGNLLELNERFEEESGYSREEMIGKNVFTSGVLTKASANTARFYLTKLLAGEHGPIFEIEGVKKDGDLIPYELKAVPIEKDGSIVAIQAILRDITERKKAEKALRESEGKYRDLVENINEVIYTINEKGSVTYVNRAIESVLGYGPSEIVGRPFSEFVHHEDLPTMRDRFREILAGHVRTSEYRLLHRDGGIRWVHASSEPVYAPSGPIGLKGVIIDVTESKLASEALAGSEEKYRSLVDHALVGVYTTNVVGDILYVNEAAAAIFEFDSAEEMMSRGVLQRYRNQQDREAFLEILLGDRVVTNFEMEVLTKRGGIKTVLLSAALDGDNISGMIMDITERKRAEEELKRAYVELRETQEQLIQSEKLAALGRFSSGVGHEIKNPLGVILGGVGFLEKKLADADRDIRTAIDKIKESTLRADSTLQSLLKFARPSELRKERIRLQGLIEETLSLLVYRASLEGVEITTQFPVEDLYIKVDKNQLQQVLFNLLLNAVEAMPQGGKIHLKMDKQGTSDLVPEHQECLIKLTDTGPGIPTEHAERLFEPFFTTKRDKKGTGLGLSISKMIVDRHGGDLAIKSAPGQGTEVTLTLPLDGGGDRWLGS